MHHHNPNDEFRLKLEDPLSLMTARAELMKNRKFELKTPMTGGRSPTRGGFAVGAANQQLLHDLEQHDQGGHHGEDAQVELEREMGGAGRHGILSSLPKAERKRLVKEYRSQEKDAKRAKVAAGPYTTPLSSSHPGPFCH